MKKILPLLFLALAFSGNDASAATVTTVKDICKCHAGEVVRENDSPFVTKAYAAYSACASWECNNACVATFATNKNQYTPNENVTISVDYSGSNPPTNWGCAAEVNGSGQLTNSLAFVSPSSPYTHAAPATTNNYTQSVSALYTCGNHPVATYDCEYYGSNDNTQLWTFPNFSEAFLPFSVTNTPPPSVNIAPVVGTLIQQVKNFLALKPSITIRS